MNITKEQADKVIALADQIACLGNGERPGNSHGNELGKQIASIMRGLAEDAEPVAIEKYPRVTKSIAETLLGRGLDALSQGEQERLIFAAQRRLDSVMTQLYTASLYTSPQAAQTEAQEREEFEAWYADQDEGDDEPERTYELDEDGMNALTKHCVWTGWKAGRAGRKV